jgi:hypothetical protein
LLVGEVAAGADDLAADSMALVVHHDAADLGIDL